MLAPRALLLGVLHGHQTVSPERPASLYRIPAVTRRKHNAGVFSSSASVMPAEWCLLNSLHAAECAALRLVSKTNAGMVVRVAINNPSSWRLSAVPRANRCCEEDGIQPPDRFSQSRASSRNFPALWMCEKVAKSRAHSFTDRDLLHTSTPFPPAGPPGSIMRSPQRGRD